MKLIDLSVSPYILHKVLLRRVIFSDKITSIQMEKKQTMKSHSHCLPFKFIQDWHSPQLSFNTRTNTLGQPNSNKIH